MSPINPAASVAAQVARIPLGEPAALVKPGETQQGSGPSDVGSAFADTLSHALDATNQVQAHADATTRAFAAGADVPVHQVMMQLTEADMSMRLLTAVTAKAISAYREIITMQI